RRTGRGGRRAARDHQAGGAVAAKLCALGARRDGRHADNLDPNEEYEPATNRWRSRAPLPTLRSGAPGAVLSGRVFVIGGETPAKTFSDNEAYDPATNTWTKMAPMPTARHGLGAAGVGAMIYLLAGGPQPGATHSAANEAFRP